MVESEKDWWLAADIFKTEARKTISKNERLLRRDPNHPDREKLLQSIEANKSGLESLSEYYTDDVIERVVQSRTNPDGSVEFVDADTFMRNFEKYRKQR